MDEMQKTDVLVGYAARQTKALENINIVLMIFLVVAIVGIGLLVIL